MPKYNHLFSIAFSVVSEDADANDVTDEMLREALRDRLRCIDEDDMVNACNNEQDTYEMDTFDFKGSIFDKGNAK